MPKLPFAEVEDGIFREVERWTLPKTIEKRQWEFSPLLCCFGGAGAPPGAAPSEGVRVLHEQKVGGYEVNVVEADDAEELTLWIKKHGYSADPELYEWLKPYVTARWKITAFKIMQDPTTGKLATTKAVRTSFTTDRPFFPYREPEGKPAKKEGGSGNKDNPPPPTEIDGIWRVDSVHGDAKEGSKLLGTKFHFRQTVAVGRFLKDTRLKVDPTKEPKWIDVGNSPGIYKLDGEKLHWCQGKDARPTRFDSKEGLLLVLRRDKKAEADDAAEAAASSDWRRLHDGGRLLRVLLVSDKRMEGKLGMAPWHAKVPWSNELTQEQRSQLSKETGVADEEIPAKAWMTAFEDRSSPRPAKDDVYFDPAQDQSPVTPPPFIKYNEVWIPIDCVLITLLLAALAWVFVYPRIRRGRVQPS